MSQLDYTIDQAAGFEGQAVDLSIKDIESHAAQGEILIGKVVTQGTALGQIIHPDTALKITDEKLVKGIAMHSHALESKAGNYSYPTLSQVPVMRKGRIWVRPEDVVTHTTQSVHVRFVTGTGTRGGLRGATVASETAILPKAKWKTSTTAVGQLAQLEIDL